MMNDCFKMHYTSVHLVVSNRHHDKTSQAKPDGHDVEMEELELVRKELRKLNDLPTHPEHLRSKEKTPKGNLNGRGHCGYRRYYNQRLSHQCALVVAVRGGPST